MSRDETPPVPRSLAGGRYQIGRLLGEGARKRVYLTHDTRLDRDVALAFIKTEGLDEAGMLRVRREMQSMGRLGDHPHVVTVYDVGEEDSQPYIISQYMSGGSVEDLLGKGSGAQGGDGQTAEGPRPLPVDQAVRIAAQISGALQHAHAHGVIHRDLKPANVWLTADGTAKLGDFGLAVTRDRSRLTVEGMMVGTVAYMPPEQALGKPADARSDLYALGAMLYEMVTGRPPFVGGDAVAVVSQHLHTAPVAPSWHNPSVPQALEALIVRLLEKDAAKRPQDAATVGAALSAIVDSRARLTEHSSTATHEEPRDRDPASQPSTSSPNPLDRLERGIFVGREPEMQVLRAGVEHSLAGRGQLLLLVGEPGVGKTRTAQEVATYAQLRGMQVLWGRCYEGGGAPAYWPWTQALRAYVHERSPTDLLAEMGPGATDIAQILSVVRERLPDLPAPLRVEPDQERFRLFDSLTTFLKNAAARQPLLLVLDDLHWADATSLLLLQFLAREMADARLLVIGTLRGEEVQRAHPLFGTLAELARTTVCQRVALGGLSAADVGHYIERTAGRKPPDVLIEAVSHETEGNPFFVGEVVRLLVSEGRLDDAQTGSIGLPPGVREVIGRRLDRLSAECNRMLTIAAVVGRDFGLELLAPVSELSPERVLELLDEAVAARVITEAPETIGRYSFAHALFRQTLSSELSTTRRLRVHRQIGAALEGLNAQRPNAYLSELAYHFAEAAPLGVADKAVTYARRAAERATALFAYEDAVSHYERALRAAENAGGQDQLQRCEILLALGENQYRAGDRDKAAPTFQQAFNLAKQLAVPQLVGRAALGIAAPFVTRLAYELGAFDDVMIAALEEALAMLGESDRALRVRLLSCLANALNWSPFQERSNALSEQAVTLARQLDDPATLIAALLSQCIALEQPENIERRLVVQTELLRVADATGDRQTSLAVHDTSRVILLALGRLDEMEVEARTFERLAEESREPQFQYHAMQWKAMRALLEGRFDAAAELAQQTLVLGQRIRNPGAVQGFAVQTALLKREHGTLHELEAPIRGFVDRYPTFPVWRCGLALLYSEADRREDARREFEAVAAKEFRDIRRDVYLLSTLSLLSEVCAFLGDARRAELLYALLLPHARLYGVAGGAACYGSVSRFLGLLSATMKRWDAVDAHFAVALEANARLRARPWLARTQCDYATALLARGAPGDRAKAMDLLNEASDTARTLGMKALLDKVLALKLEAHGIDRSDTETSIDVLAASVEAERPNLRRHAAPDGTVTVLFTDIEGFTAMTERLGDQRAVTVLRAHNALVREQVKRYAGFEVKSQGDGFMMVFASARQALLCAVAVQRALAAYRAEHPEEPVRVRIGLHTGETIKEGEDFFGGTVNLAARIAAAAQGGEILVSSVLKELTEGGGDIHFGAARAVELKGLSGTRTLFQVPWMNEPSSAGE